MPMHSDIRSDLLCGAEYRKLHRDSWKEILPPNEFRYVQVFLLSLCRYLVGRLVYSCWLFLYVVKIIHMFFVFRRRWGIDKMIKYISLMNRIYITYIDYFYNKKIRLNQAARYNEVERGRIWTIFNVRFGGCCLTFATSLTYESMYRQSLLCEWTKWANV